MKKLKLQELNRVNVESYQKQDKLPLVIVLDNIRSATNVGSFFRTSDAYLVQKICLTGITAKPPHKEITKTAIGATNSVAWEYFDSIKECCLKLKDDGFILYGIEQTNQSIDIKEMSIQKNEKVAFIFGNEVMGLSEDVLPLLYKAIELPQHGTKHSLNVAVCGGIIIWEVYNRLF
jgi:tRNA G18 (ribose-2'-O)-methylase SpoU